MYFDSTFLKPKRNNSFFIKKIIHLSLFKNIFPVKPLACNLGLLTLFLSLLLLDPESFDFVDLLEEGDATDPEETLSFLLLIGDRPLLPFSC